MIDLIDTHCHLNVSEYFPDPEPFIKAAASVGVRRMVLVTLDVKGGPRAVELAERHEGLFAIVGHHPNYAADYSSDELGELERMLKHPKVVALGEIGLDYHWDHASKEQQLAALKDQLDLAASLGKPVVFHCREAYRDLLELLESRAELPYLFHCFSGDADDAKRALILGGYFGVDGPITYKSKAPFREFLSTLPRDRIVLETDSPYLTPEPHRGKSNQPAYLTFVNEALAKVWNVAAEESARITTSNAERFFRLAG